MKRGIGIVLPVAVMFLCLSGTAQAVTISIPEIDGSSMASALAFLAGAAVLLGDRLRRRKAS